MNNVSGTDTNEPKRGKPLKVNIKKEKVKKKKNKTTEKGIREVIEVKDIKKESISKPKAKGEVLDKHRHNAREILRCSNATPIKSHRGIGYSCCFCKEQFPDPTDLKKHTIEKHDTDISNFMKGKSLLSYYVKLDITALSCTLCDSNISTVESLIGHLTETHKKIIYTDISQRILPFKFGDDTLTCFICFNIFSNFKALQEHMNAHYRNFICEICDAGFVSQHMLHYHSYVHKTGSFKCDTCHLVFDTLPKKKFHERSVHKVLKLYKCGFCNERFKENWHKTEHLSEVHGIKAPTAVCLACNKTFVSNKALKLHMKRLHLMEKRHMCSECPMGFFTGAELARHMVKHTGTKDFRCEVCLKSYGRKKTLIEHMKIHNNDRRFKCEHCGQAFVQKCSWRGHMRSRHGEDI